MRIPVSFRTAYARANKQILVDSGATDNFIYPRLIQQLGLGTQHLPGERKIWNIDGTANKAGMILEFVDLRVQTQGRTEQMRFLIMDLGTEDLILGYPWLAVFEHKFQWRDASIDVEYLPIIIQSLNWEKICQQIQDPINPTSESQISRIEAIPLSDDDKDQIVLDLSHECKIKTSIVSQLAQEVQQYTKKVEIPKEYKRHWRVFSEEAHQFPPSRPWDHAIKLKEGVPKAIDCKVYPTTLTEDEALSKFIQEQLEKGYISKSKSPYASPFFFIKKKDGKLHPVQDYRKLNEYTIKNKYPLPLNPDLIAQVKDAWIFTKFDIRWGYNNIHIKEGDQHMAAFKMKYGLFEPNVMYFGLTNSPAMFQAMMDHLFQPVHNEFSIDGTDVLKYMDDLLIATQSTRAHHQKAVHKILDILEANQLFVHPEKCTWESLTVDYLGLILEKGVCYVTVGTFARRGLSSTAKTLRSLSGVRGSEY